MTRGSKKSRRDKRKKARRREPFTTMPSGWASVETDKRSFEELPRYVRRRIQQKGTITEY